MTSSSQQKPPSRRPRRRPDVRLRLSSIIATQLDLLAPGANVDALLRVVAGKAQRLTGAVAAAVELLDGEELVFRAACGDVAGSLGMRVKVSGSLPGLCMSLRTVLRCDDAHRDGRVNHEVCQRLGMRSMLATPLWHGERLIGALEVFSSEPEDFTDEDAETLQLMSSLVSTAIVRAEEDESQRKLLEERERAAQQREQLIQQREGALRALEESQATLRAFFDATPLGMGTLERRGDDFVFLTANAALASAYGLEGDELAIKSVSQLPDLHSGLSTSLLECEAQRQPVTWESSTGTGPQRRCALNTASPLPSMGDGPTRFCFVTQDITERVRLRERADLAERMASLGRLAAGVAHEANNPLAYVLSNLGFALSELAALTPQNMEQQLPEVVQALQEASEGAERVRVVVRDLHAFAAADTERRGLIDLPSAVKKCLAMAKREIENRARVHAQFGDTPPVMGNEARLGQVLLNLLVNAAHALPVGGAEQNEIHVQTGMLEDGRVFIDVRDTGHGIAPELLPRIFDPFYTTKPLGQGMGLGLSISHNIVAAHGGELMVVESTVGRGTTFRVALPAANAAIVT